MSIRRTLGDVRGSIALVLGMCPTDERVPDYINQAQEILMNRGRWTDNWQRFRMCVDKKGCITWPRQIGTIEAWGHCSVPGIVRNQWFEFQQNGPGLVDSKDDIGMQMIDRGGACSFDDIEGDDKKIRVYADIAETTPAYIILQGYDQNNNWIQTEYPAASGTYIDGERVLISTTPQTTTNFFKALVSVLKPVTKGNVRLYEYQPSTGGSKALAIYEPTETRPWYRRSQIPNLESQCGCSTCEEDSDDTCGKKQVTVMATLQFIPSEVDNDWLMISNLAALRYMVQSIQKMERNLVEEAQAYELKAVKELQSELDTYEGDGQVSTIRFQSRFEFGAGAVMNVI